MTHRIRPLVTSLFSGPFAGLFAGLFAAGTCVFGLLAMTSCKPPPTTTPHVTSLRLEKITPDFEWAYHTVEEGMTGSFTFRVFDGQGRPVENLAQHNFQFFEDGNPADVESASDAAQLKLNISLILDGSESIDQANAAQVVRSSAERLVMQLHHKANFRFYSFANDSREHALVDEWATVGRFTSLYDAVHQAAADSIERHDNAIIVVFTDGDDNHSQHSLDETVALLEQHNVLVYAIGMGNLQAGPLEAMAGVGGGSVALAASPAQLQQTFDDIRRRLGGIYRVSYLSPARSGAHELTFRVALDQAFADHVSSFVVDPNATLVDVCGPGTKTIPGSPGLCCPSGSTQIPGAWACGTCPGGHYPVPGTSRCCPAGKNPIPGQATCTTGPEGVATGG